MGTFLYNMLNENEIEKTNAQRFASVTEEDLNALLENAQAQNTKYKTTYAVNIFKGT